MSIELADAIDEVERQSRPAAEPDDVDIGIARSQVLVQLLQAFVNARVTTRSGDTSDHLPERSEPCAHALAIETLFRIGAPEPQDVRVVLAAWLVAVPRAVEGIESHVILLAASRECEMA